MIIVPREKPVFQNLNSYYIELRKMLEHFQGELGTGAIHCQSSSSEGIIFFEENEFLSAVYKDAKGQESGPKVLKKIEDAASKQNFTINIYELHPEKVSFWANLPFAQELYKGLSTEFTDLQGLIKKMNSERLTGYISASIRNGNEEGLLFFHDGDVIGGSYSWNMDGEFNNTEQNKELLIRKTKESGGIFNVYTIALSEEGKSPPSEAVQSLPSAEVMPLLQECLNATERLIDGNKKIKQSFSALLRKKFIEKSETYEFLDPFAAELEYSDGRIEYFGDADGKRLVQGIVESIREMADEQNISDQLESELAPLKEKYAHVLSKPGLAF